MAALYLIGIDGGGSSTRARLADGSGRVLGHGEAGPSGLSLGVGSAWAQIDLAIERAFASAGLPPAPPQDCALGLGLAGVNFKRQAEDFLRAGGRFANLVLETDGAAMLMGAFGGKPGVVVAAGTGSVGEALRRDGSRASVGGWGFPVGDEGSGAWLGMGAVRAAQWARDGRAPRGALAEAVYRSIGADSEAILAWCAQAGQGAYARLAPIVFEAADADPAAHALLRAAAAAAREMADALDPSGQLPVALCGSVGRRLVPYVPDGLAPRLREPEGDAVDGALLLARRAAAGGAPRGAIGVANG
ncbi:MAG TPA: BadF/BadG/BcrA/BcrD ATPase family protein [Burkholderiaceae bacterium]